MKLIIAAVGWTAAAIVMSGAASTPAKQAPAITSARWFNSAPLADKDLRGKVRLVEFWTFECINCRRTLPAMKALHQRYSGADAIVIGVHSPELEDEYDLRKVGQAIEQLDVRYPVAVDNDHAIWRAFGNHYWPALYVVDKRGIIRHVHAGELHEGTPDWDALIALVDRLRREPA